MIPDYLQKIWAKVYQLMIESIEFGFEIPKEHDKKCVNNIFSLPW